MELHYVFQSNLEVKVIFFMKRFFSHHWHHVLLLCIVLLAGYLRLYKISEYMTFLGDEGRDMLVVKRMIVDHKFTLLGPTASVGGFFLGPIYYYFMLPFVWASGMNPAGAAAMVGLFGIATVVLLYKVGKDFIDVWTGLIAALLYSVSPLVIAYSRSSWNPNVVPFFALSLIYLLWRAGREMSRLSLFLIGVALGIGMQLHYLFLFLFPVVGVWFLFYGRNIKYLKLYGIGVFGFLVGYAPFLAFELRHGFPNTISITRFLLSGSDTGFNSAQFISIITDVSYRLFGRLVFRLPPPEQFVNVSLVGRLLWESVIKFSLWASIAMVISFLVGFLKPAWIKKGDTSWYRTMVLFAVWFIIPLVLFGFYKKGIYDYYFGIFFPLPFLFVAMLLRVLGSSRMGIVFAGIFLSILVIFNWEGRPFKFLPNNQLAQARMIAKEAYEKAEGKPFNFALLANFNSDHVYRYFFEIWGSPPVTIERNDVDPLRTTVTDQLIVICDLPECKPLGHPLWEIAGFGRAEVVGEWPSSFVRIMKLVHYDPIKEINK